MKSFFNFLDERSHYFLFKLIRLLSKLDLLYVPLTQSRIHIALNNIILVPDSWRLKDRYDREKA